LVIKKIKYNSLSTCKTEKAILRTRQIYYELGEKTHKVLAWQIKAEENSRTINSIETQNGQVSHNPEEMNDSFKQYYSKLYTSDGTSNDRHISVNY
jgi:hypothetical protein